MRRFCRRVLWRFAASPSHHPQGGYPAHKRGAPYSSRRALRSANDPLQREQRVPRQVALRSAMRKGTRLGASGVGGCKRGSARRHPQKASSPS